MPSVATKLDPFERDIALLVPELAPAAQIDAFRAGALDALSQAQETNRQALGYVPPHDTFLDGAPSQALAGLKVDSVVVFAFSLIGDALEWIDAQLILSSPVRSGRYAKSHVWFADGVEFDDASNPPPAAVYTVLNAQPYARKIERGLSAQAPDGVYQGVATLAAGRFGNLARIKFGYESFPGGAIGRWAQSDSAKDLARRVKGGRQDRHLDWLTRQPAITITV